MIRADASCRCFSAASNGCSERSLLLNMAGIMVASCLGAHRFQTTVNLPASCIRAWQWPSHGKLGPTGQNHMCNTYADFATAWLLQGGQWRSLRQQHNIAAPKYRKRPQTVGKDPFIYMPRGQAAQQSGLLSSFAENASVVSMSRSAVSSSDYIHRMSNASFLYRESLPVLP